MKDFKLKIGCTAVITDSGENYTTYYDAADWMGLKNYRSMKSPENGTVVTVVNFCLHHETGRLIIGIKDDSGHEFIIGWAGLKLCNRVTMKEFKRAFGQDAVLVDD